MGQLEEEASFPSFLQMKAKIIVPLLPFLSIKRNKPLGGIETLADQTEARQEITHTPHNHPTHIIAGLPIMPPQLGEPTGPSRAILTTAVAVACGLRSHRFSLLV
jgi:hypothetical protein